MSSDPFFFIEPSVKILFLLGLLIAGIFFLLKFFHSVVLVSALQQSTSAIITHTSLPASLPALPQPISPVITAQTGLPGPHLTSQRLSILHLIVYAC